MAPRGTKRAAQATEKKAVEKKARLSPEEESLQNVIVAIHGAEHVPLDCRELLVTVAKGSLNVVKEERHPSQDKVVAMIAEVLADMCTTKSAALAEEAEKVKAADGTLATLRAACEAAANDLCAKLEAVKAAEDKVASAEATAAEAASGKEAAEGAMQLAQEAQTSRESESKSFDAAVKENFAALLDGTWELPEQAQQHMETLVPYTAQLQLDESLRSALPAACVKPIASRGSFDCLVLEQAQKAFTDKAAELRAAFAECTPAVAQAAAALEAAQQTLEAAQGTVAELKAALEEAKGEESSSAAATDAKTKEMTTFEKEFKILSKGHNQAKAELQLAQAPLADFESLRDRTAKIVEAAAEATAEAATLDTATAVGGA